MGASNLESMLLLSVTIAAKRVRRSHVITMASVLSMVQQLCAIVILDTMEETANLKLHAM
jgi:hypothetical protein